jgi:Nif-specific regulatory protein
MKCLRGEGQCYGERELSLLSEISSRLMRNKNTRDELYLVLQYLCKTLDAESSFLTIFDTTQGKISIEVAYGLNRTQQDRGQYLLGEGIIGRVVELQKSVCIPHISKSPLFLNKTKSGLTKKGKELSFICVPVLHDGKVAGTLSVTREFRSTERLEDNKNLLSVIGGLIVQSLKSSQERSV